MANLKLIKKLARDRGIPLNLLAERVGIHEAGLNHIIRNNSVKMDVLERIAEQLNVNPIVFFQKDDDTPLITDQIARTLYSAAMSLSYYFEIHNKPEITKWDLVSDRMKQATLFAVNFIIAHPNISPEDLHKIYKIERIENGWKLGKDSNDDEKNDPNLVPFQDLEDYKKATYRISIEIVRSFSGFSDY